jgi:hypothetical protein
MLLMLIEEKELEKENKFNKCKKKKWPNLFTKIILSFKLFKLRKKLFQIINYLLIKVNLIIKKIILTYLIIKLIKINIVFEYYNLSKFVFINVIFYKIL